MIALVKVVLFSYLIYAIFNGKVKKIVSFRSSFPEKKQKKNKTKTKFKILFRFDEFSWGSIAGVFVVLDVLWDIMQHSLKIFQA